MSSSEDAATADSGLAQPLLMLVATLRDLDLGESEAAHIDLASTDWATAPWKVAVVPEVADRERDEDDGAPAGDEEHNED